MKIIQNKKLPFTQKGQSIVEVIIAMAVFALIGAAMVTLVVGGFTALEQGGEQTEAAAIAQEGMEAVRAIYNRSWDELRYNQSGVSISSGQWVFDGEGTSDVIGQYTRAITFSNACRNASGDIADCPAAAADANTKKVISAVSWPIREGLANSARRVCYFMNSEGHPPLNCDWSLLSVPDGGTYNYPGQQDGTKVQAQNGYAYAIINANGGPDYDFAIHDVSDPNNPTVVGSLAISTQLPESLTNIAVSGDYAYVSSAKDDSELYIINISDPTNPSIENMLDLPGSNDAKGIYVVGNTVYLVKEGSNSAKELFIVDADNPASPALLGSADIGGNNKGGNEVYVNGSYAYISSPDTNQNLKIVDVSSPSNPVYLSDSGYEVSQSNNKDALTVYGFDNVVIVGSNDGFVYFIDVTDPTAVDQDSEISYYDIGDIVNDISVGDYLGVANAVLFVVSDVNVNDELQIVDISDINNPAALSTHQFGLRLLGVAFDGDECGIYVAGAPNASKPEFYVVITGDTNPPGEIIDLALSGATESSIILTWSAPGDDGMVGIAASYDVRYSTAVITDLNWASAVQASGEPTPSISDTIETMIVLGLSAGTAYYFAIKTSDEVPNESGLSNAPSLATQSAISTCAAYCQSQSYSTGTCRANNAQCNANGETREAAGDVYCDGGQSADTCCCAP